MTTHQDYYTDDDKVSILAEAMLCDEAKEMVLNFQVAGYTAAMEELQENYGKKSVIYLILVEQLIQRQRYDYTTDGMKEMIRRSHKVLEEMNDIDGKDTEMLDVALVVKDMDAEVRKEWQKFLGNKDDLPNISDLKNFAMPLAKHLDKRNSESTWVKRNPQTFTSSQSNPTSKMTIEVNKSIKMENKSCVICKDQSHSIYKCNKFTDASVTQKWNWTKQHKMCSNCLNTNHQLADCTSTYRCRHCGEKHNYLLH